MRVIIRTKASGAAFVHPFDPGAKTAVLMAGFRNTRTVRVFPGGWCQQAARFHPAAIAAPIDELRRLGHLRIDACNAAIVLTRGAKPLLTQEDRDLIWEALGVPVFEQCLGPNNRLLAFECEAHDGLHLRVPPGPALETSICACGRATPRLMPEREFDKLVQAAAVALTNPLFW